GACKSWATRPDAVEIDLASTLSGLAKAPFKSSSDSLVIVFIENPPAWGAIEKPGRRPGLVAAAQRSGVLPQGGTGLGYLRLPRLTGAGTTLGRAGLVQISPVDRLPRGPRRYRWSGFAGSYAMHANGLGVTGLD